MIVVLAGGVGGSKFVKGVSLAADEEVTAIINTGDDFERFGLHISPDIDINLYALANVIHEQGWGFKDESYNCQSILSTIYQEDCWFNLGDKDLATHIYRTHLLKQQKTLTEITDLMCQKMGISTRIVPMCNESVQTYIETPEGNIHFQEYLVKRKMEDRVLDIHFMGAESAQPAPGIIESIGSADMIFIAPSNPFVSIGPIFSVPGIREAIRKSDAKVAAVSPIIGGKAVKGPAERMMRDLNIDVSPIGIASLYRDLLDVIIIDDQDKKYEGELENDGLHVLVTNTIMDSDESKKMLANDVIQFVKRL